MLVLYLALIALGVAMAVFADALVDANRPANVAAERLGNIAGGIFIAVLSAGMSILFAVGMVIPRRKWGWIYGFIPIAIGLTSPCCIPASLPLLWFWLKPENKQWFHVT